MSYRAWSVTSFDLTKVDLFKTLQEGVKYSVAQVEKCPETGRLHIQGFVRFVKPCRLTHVKALYGADLHCEKSVGTDAQNRSYCTKEESRQDGPWECGTAASQGARTDLATFKESIISGSSMRELVEKTPDLVARYPKFVQICMGLARPSMRDVQVLFIYGPPGSGKTRSVYETESDVYSVASYRPEWWDGYSSESAVLFDDLTPTSLPIDRLLRLLDRYPVQVPFKGGFAWLRAERIYITTNFPPEAWFPGRVAQQAFTRRISNFINMEEPLPSPPTLQREWAAGEGTPQGEGPQTRNNGVEQVGEGIGPSG